MDRGRRPYKLQKQKVIMSKQAEQSKVQQKQQQQQPPIKLKAKIPIIIKKIIIIKIFSMRLSNN